MKSGTTRTILLVEDEPDIRASMREALESAGHRVIAASNGREALEMLRESPKPSMILLDLMMPVMNGWDFAEAVQSHPQHAGIPIVVVTALTQEADRRRIVARGVLTKPVDLDRLFHVVEEVCS